MFQAPRSCIFTDRGSGAIQENGDLPSADQELRGVGQGGLVDPPGEHPGELPAALLALDAVDAGDRTPPRLLFLDNDVRARFRGYLRQVRDRQDLVALAKLSEFRPDRRGSLAADTGAHPVE